MINNFDPLISTIIPVYNAEKYIKRAVESVLNQTYENIELILIDDGSTDNSSFICDELAKTDKRVTVIHKTNNGVSSARNDGLKISHGEYIHFIDADDWISLDCYEQIIPMMIDKSSNLRADVAFFGWLLEQQLGKSVELSLNCYSGYGTQDIILEYMLSQIGSLGNYQSYGNYIWNKIFRKKSLYDVDGNLVLFPEDIAIAEDGIWLVEVAKNWNNGYFCNIPYYHYFQNDDSVMNNKEKFIENRLASQKSHKIMLENLKTYNLKAYEIHRDVCTNFFFGLAKTQIGCEKTYVSEIINNILDINDGKCSEVFAQTIVSLIEENRRLKINSSIRRLLKIKIKRKIKKILFLGKNNETN